MLNPPRSRRLSPEAAANVWSSMSSDLTLRPELLDEEDINLVAESSPVITTPKRSRSIKQRAKDKK